MANRPVLAANWKMNPLNIADVSALVGGFLEVARSQSEVQVALFPPYVWLLGVVELLADTGIDLGAQDCFWEPSGAYTGEISAQMLAGICQWVIVGHSERRALGETDEQVARKAGATLATDLSVIICVGENQAQHDAGQAAEVVTAQVKAAMSECSADDSARLVLAYEPVWAIGTGKSADPEHAYRTMRIIRQAAADMIGAQAGQTLRVIYGGSVNAANIEAYVELPQCDGCLVGGASLNADEFSDMIRKTVGVYSAGATT